MFLSSYPFIHPVNPLTVPVAPYMNLDPEKTGAEQASDPDTVAE